jgi:hypothetical protein
VIILGITAKRILNLVFAKEQELVGIFKNILATIKLYSLLM